MEYVAGPTLADWLDHNQPTLAQAEALFLGIVSGVSRAHREGLVHRDLKPSNVLLCELEEGVVPMVTDFGLAKVVNDVSSGVHTRSGMMMGTPAYMAPEQVQDAASVDARADIFALGCILYEMVCGRPPFDGPDPLSIFGRLAIGDYVAPESLVPTLPERFRRTIRACLHVDREHRVRDCRSLRLLFVGHDEAEAPLARPVPLLEGRSATIHQTLEPAGAKLPSRSPTIAQASSRAGETMHPAAFHSQTAVGAVPAFPAEAAPGPAMLPSPSLTERTAPRISITGSLAPTSLPEGFSTGPLPGSGRPWVAVSALGCAATVALSGLLIITVGGAGAWFAGGRLTPLNEEISAPAAVAENAPTPEPAQEGKSVPEAKGDVPDEIAVAATAPALAPSPESGGPAASGTTGGTATIGTKGAKPAAPAHSAPVAAKPLPAVDTTTKPEASSASATWSLVGDADAGWVEQNGTRHTPGALAPGEYTIYARFGGSELAQGSLSARAGQTYTVKCAAAFKICRVASP
jgi:hypothetical protein